MCKKLIQTLFLSLMAFVSTVATATDLDNLLPAQNEFLKVNQAFQFSSEQLSDSRVALSWQIADGYYLYRDKLKIEGKDVTLTPITMPEAESHEDEFFGVTSIYHFNLNLEQQFTVTGEHPTLTLTYMGCSHAGLCYPPVKQKVVLEKPASPTTPSTDNATKEQLNQSELAGLLENQSMLLTLGAFFLLGIGLAFTPCVFPMYPILSGVIAGQQNLSTGRAFILSLVYVQGMAVTYTLLGLVVASFGAQVQIAFQHPAVLIGLSILFVVLALSMFGLYTIQLPASMMNSLNEKSAGLKGGRFGSVLLLGIIAGLVASPCTTAPLSAALLYVAESGDMLLGGLALYALSMGMGVPLLLVGTAGARLLPRSGAWMDVVKHSFGFIMLALPILLLERIWPELFSHIAWAALALSFGAYLLHASKGIQRALGATIMNAAAFTLMFTGGILAYQMIQPAPVHVEKHAFEFTPTTTKQQLLDQLAQAKAEGKPVLLDLYADWCVACKEFDKYTFTDAGVQKALLKYTLLRADLTHSTEQDIELMEHLDVLGLPTLVLYDPQGNELKAQRIAGFLGPEAFIAHLNDALPD